MAQCVAIDGASGALVVVDVAPCTSLLVLTPAEYATLANSPWFLSPEDGALVGASIVGVWAAAYFWRAAVRALNVGDHGSEDE